MDQGVYTIVGAGLSSAAAPTRHQTLDALKDRRTLLDQASSFTGPDDKPLVCAFRDPTLAADLATRLAMLVIEAIDDLLANQADPLPGPLVLSLPELAPGEGTEFVLTRPYLQYLIYLITERLTSAGMPPPEGVTVTTSGAPGPVEALQALGPRPPGSDVLLCSVDSYACRKRLQALLSRKGLFSTGSPCGVVPGEAAVALRLRFGAPVRDGVSLVGIASARETQSKGDGCDAAPDALSTALCRSAAALGNPAHILTTGWNDSRDRAAEVSQALERLPSDTLSEQFEVVHPAQRFGVVGACALPLATVMTLSERSGAALHCGGATRTGSRASWGILPPWSVRA